MNTKKQNLFDRVFDITNIIIMVLLSIVCLYPLYYCLMASLSNPVSLFKSGGMLIYPKGFHLGAYAAVFKNHDILTGYINTILYVFVGASLNIVLTMLGGYVLAQRDLTLRRLMNLFVVITMFINGGMIPLYLVVKSLGLIDNRMALILPVAINTYNLIMARTYVSTIPKSLEEAAKIDGANEITILFVVIVPLSLPIIAVLALYYAVYHWNAWFNAMIYLSSRDKFPMQLILREILIQSEASSTVADYSADKQPVAECIKYATIIVATVPILFVYPFVQRHFVKGVMIGAVKE